MTERGLSRDAFLQHVGSLAEELVDVPGMGKVLARELTGAQRAKLLAILAPAATGGSPDFERYQETLLQLGLVDPSDGQPLLDLESVKKAMQLGAGKVEALCSAIERLSGLGDTRKAVERAEGNSEPTGGSSATSA